MKEQVKARFTFLRAMRRGTLDANVQEALTREEKSGGWALLYFRLFACVAFTLGGMTASPSPRDIVVNLIFAAAYGSVVVVQWSLLKTNLQRAFYRFNFFMVFADHALFASQIVLYYSLTGTGNFNHAMKSPYVVLLLVPTLMTLLQFRHTLTFFSVGVLLVTLLGFLGFALLSGVPQTNNWVEYVLGNAIMLPAWLGLWFLLALSIGVLVSYTLFRSIRMVAQIGHSEGQKKEFARYFSPALVEEIISGGEALENLKRGARRNVAVLFADIRSFTALSEKLSPDALLQMLARLRELQMQAVFEHQGMVDKFIGDAIMAVFGAPHSAGSFRIDVQNAVLAGIQMHRALRLFNNERKERGEEEIRIGIGIHAGEAFVGNVGGEGQLEYTTIGDVVNTASRIEHLCKKAQADFLVSEAVARAAEGRFEHERLGVVKIRGKEKPMAIYKVLH